MINLLDEEYDPREDTEYLESKSYPKRKTRIITRNEKKRQLEKERSDIQDDDTIEQERQFSRFNERFEQVRDRQQTQQDLILKLFGERSRLDVLDFEKYRKKLSRK